MFAQLPAVYCMGAACQDTIVVVQKYPNRDDKVRSESMIVQGGGNAANTISAISRLTRHTSNVRTGLITKIGGSEDPITQQILTELTEDGVSTSSTVMRATESTTRSPQTFIVNDVETNSRTCIHVPMSEEVTVDDIEMLWQLEMCDPQLPMFIHFDSRHPAGAVHLAQLAVEQKVPISLDIEKFRPGADELLGLCDIIFTNERFPDLFARERCSGKSSDIVLNMISILSYGRANCVVTTCGQKGAILVRWSEISVFAEKRWLKSHSIHRNMFDDLPSFNATISSTTAPCGRQCTVIRCPIWPFDQRPIVDSTGAGDSFIGGVITGLLHGLGDEECLKLGALVASEKLRGAGARKALPDSERVKIIISEANAHS